MGYFDNYKKVDLKELRESGIYSEKVLKAIETGDYKTLKSPEVITQEQRQDEKFMGPIVYAYKKQNGSFIVFKSCAKELQKNFDFAIDIIKEEPEVIEDTDVSSDREFIQKIALHKPEIIKHMSETLKSDTIFTAELCELNDSEITKYAAQECKMPETIQQTPELLENKAFLLGAIQNDENSWQYVSDELKNDGDFIKDVCSSNKEAIDYISEHTEEFGVEGLKGAQSVLKEDFKKEMDEEIKLIPELKRLQQLQENEEELSDEERKELKELQENPKLKQLQENISKREQKKGETIDLDARQEDFERHGEILDRRLEGLEEGNEKAIKFARRLLKCDLDPQYRAIVEKSLKIGEAIIERQGKNKDKDVETEKEFEITPKDVEARVERTASLQKTKEETANIREEIQGERANQRGVEITNDESYGERT